MVQTIAMHTGLLGKNEGYFVKGRYFNDFEDLQLAYPFLNKTKFNYAIEAGYTAEDIVHIVFNYNEYPKKLSVFVNDTFYKNTNDFFEDHEELDEFAFKKAVKRTGTSYADVYDTYLQTGEYLTIEFLQEEARKKGKEYGVTILGEVYHNYKDFFKKHPEISESSARTKASKLGITVAQAVENKILIGTYQGTDTSVIIRGERYPSVENFFSLHPQYNRSCCKNVMRNAGLTFDEALDNYDTYGSYKGINDNRTTAVIVRGVQYNSLKDFFDSHPQYKRSSCIPVMGNYNITLDEALDNFDSYGSFVPRTQGTSKHKDDTFSA